MGPFVKGATLLLFAHTVSLKRTVAFLAGSAAVAIYMGI
jgi:hypothetical protein